MKRTMRLVCLLTFAGLAVQGCATVPAPGPHARTDAGVVEMDWRTRRNVEVGGHSFRRDRFGHLVVTVRLVNTSGDPYYACLCVDFEDGAGAYERRAHQTDTERLPPGPTAMEWTSYGPEASRYTVKIRSARFWQW